MEPRNDEGKQDFLKRCTKAGITDGKGIKEVFAACNLDWDISKNRNAALTLSGPVVPASGESDEARPFMITAYTGKPIKLFWGTVIFDLSGIKSKKKIPILREHGRDRIVGFGETWKDDKNFYVSGEFSKSTKDAKEILGLADEGYPWQASIGIFAKKVKSLVSEQEKSIVNGHEIKGPAHIWLESEVGEVSFVSLGADDQTAGITFSGDFDSAEEEELKGSIDEIVAKKAIELAKKKNIPMDQATLKVLSDNPDLLAKYEASYVI